MIGTPPCRRPEAATAAFRTSASALVTSASRYTPISRLDTGRLECNTARTLLLLNHEPLPWARWCKQFTAAMPDEIRHVQERAASADCAPRQASDPQPYQRDHAALPTEPLSANSTATATTRRVKRKQRRR